MRARWRHYTVQPLTRAEVSPTPPVAPGGCRNYLMRKASRCHEIQPWVRVVAGRRLRYTSEGGMRPSHLAKWATSRAPVRIRALRKYCCIRIVRLVALLC